MTHALRGAALALALLAAGCAHRAPVTFHAPRASIELAATPFHAQTAHHCGPAALASVLGASGVDVSPEALAPQVFTPALKGSLRAEITATARGYARVPLRLEPRPEALFDALQAAHPVLLLLNLGLQSWPRWHYAVLVGYDAAQARFILRSGTQVREEMSAQRLLSAWSRADRWALVLARPDDIPWFAAPADWLPAVAPFESLGRTALAETAYHAALLRWPHSALAWQAQANLRYARDDRTGAEQALRRALELDPGAVAARNNLAHLLLERGCVQQAQQQLDALGAPPEVLRAHIARTQAAVQAARATSDAPACAMP